MLETSDLPGPQSAIQVLLSKPDGNLALRSMWLWKEKSKPQFIKVMAIEIKSNHNSL